MVEIGSSFLHWRKTVLNLLKDYLIITRVWVSRMKSLYFYFFEILFSHKRSLECHIRPNVATNNLISSEHHHHFSRIRKVFWQKYHHEYVILFVQFRWWFIGWWRGPIDSTNGQKLPSDGLLWYKASSCQGPEAFRNQSLIMNKLRSVQPSSRTNFKWNALCSYIFNEILFTDLEK